MTTKSKETRTGARLDGLDVARYLAFVGMVMVNFKIVMGAEGGDGVLSLLIHALEGRAAATFVVLAGIGLGLAGRNGLDQTIVVTVKRALFVLVVGLLNMLIFTADILHYYAFYFFFGVLLLRLGNRALIAATVGLNIAFVAMILTLDYGAGWDWDAYTYAGFWTPLGFVRNLFFNGWHPVIPWLGFLLFGMVLGRAPLDERATQLGLVLGGVCIYGAAEAASWWLTAHLALTTPELAILATTSPVPPMPLYTLAGIGTACVVVGLCLAASNRLRAWGILGLVVPAGRQTLSLYLAHIVIGMGTLEAFGMLGGQSVTRAVAASLVFCLMATIYAQLWSKWFKRGPLETLMRSMAG